MSGSTLASQHLLTWLDVERLLKQQTVGWSKMPCVVHEVDCFSSGMEVRYSNDITRVNEWLKEIFGAAYYQETNSIQLRIGNVSYPVELIQEASGTKSSAAQIYPLWRDVTYLPSGNDNDEADTETQKTLISRNFKAPEVFTTGPELVSFHSFKGGVSRTTTLMTYVTACLRDTNPGLKKILVIDADLEAPGVSFWLDDSNRPSVSFVQLLEALHYPPAGIDKSLDFFAEQLRKTSISVLGLERELFILPAALELTEIQDMPVTPEHLARNVSNPWQLSDHLHALGRRLGVDAVFIDLRAGLSELASPILFDPRIDHFFVTTVAPQSVLGMAEVLRRLYAYNCQLPIDWQERVQPTVFLSLLTKELRSSSFYTDAIKVLGSAYPATDPLTPSVQWLEADFLNTLMSIGSVKEALESLPQANRLFTTATEWAQSLYSQIDNKNSLSDVSSNPLALEDKGALALSLFEVCRSAEFAEGEGASRILAIEPLLNLGKQFSNELPSILMIGAKGAGKTFTYRQMVSSESWQTFLSKLGFNQVSTCSTDPTIFPILWSTNITDQPDGEIKVAQNRSLKLSQNCTNTLLNNSDIQKRIRAALLQPPKHWDEFWDELISIQFGVKTGGLQEVNRILAQQSVRTILLFDGIEDAFGDVSEQNSVDAIYALLTLTNRINELENRHLGVIIFVRIDYVQAAIRQNVGQWLQRFQPYRLQWNPESFLRLAYMLGSQAEVFQSESSAESLNIEDLKPMLEQLWGRKLGKEKSKEAHSARWVYTALSDLKGNVQARDLVRFLKFAAKEESRKSSHTWSDRLLSPESMRKAIPLCSEEKVTEAKAEIASLRKWTELMISKRVRQLKIPFSAAQAALEPALLSALQEIGVIYEDRDGELGDECLFLPEIYRYGLGFETSAAGRPRMQALLKKNIGVIPL